MKKLTMILTILSFKTFAFSDPCLISDAKPGEICTGGSILAGKFQNKIYMVTPADGPKMQWGSLNIHTGVTDTANGEENTKKLANISPPAKYCDQLQFGGYSDWFLPSEDELKFLLLNANKIGHFSSEWYWSSSEAPKYPNFKPSFVRGGRVAQDWMTNLLKEWDCTQRCVRTVKTINAQ